MKTMNGERGKKALPREVLLSNNNTLLYLLKNVSVKNNFFFPVTDGN